MTFALEYIATTYALGAIAILSLHIWQWSRGTTNGLMVGVLAALLWPLGLIAVIIDQS